MAAKPWTYNKCLKRSSGYNVFSTWPRYLDYFFKRVIPICIFVTRLDYTCTRLLYRNRATSPKCSEPRVSDSCSYSGCASGLGAVTRPRFRPRLVSAGRERCSECRRSALTSVPCPSERAHGSPPHSSVLFCRLVLCARKRWIYDLNN